ncbi:hypothetical protein JTL50_33045, partial [Pseudomonas aeruginosa]|nr:hypothetical protein [Pseudomonas aeruginosa]
GARTLSETPEGNLKWLAAISTAAHLIGRLPLKLTFSTESARSSRSIWAESYLWRCVVYY